MVLVIVFIASIAYYIFCIRKGKDKVYIYQTYKEKRRSTSNLKVTRRHFRFGVHCSQFLLQCEDVLSFDTLVAHLIHNLTDEKDAEATNLALVGREGDIGLGSQGGVELLARIGEHEHNGALMQVSREIDVLMLLLGVGIVDYIDHSLLDDKVEIEDYVRGEGKGLAHLFDEGCEPADL